MTNAPAPTPIAPPTTASTTASIRICIMTSPWRAPSDLRMPISRVRSVTLTSMMFMMTMPPTTSEMQRHRHDHRRHHAEHLIDEAADGIGREDVEIVGLAGARVEARAQSDAGHIERIVQVSGPSRGAAGRRGRSLCRGRTGGRRR